MQCIVLEEDGYYDGWALYPEGAIVEWEMKERHILDGMSERQVFPPYLKPVDDNYRFRLNEELRPLVQASSSVNDEILNRPEPKIRNEEIEVNFDKIINEALNELDHDNDDHWTKENLPSVSQIRTYAKNKNIDRAMIKAANPMFVRQV